MSELRCENRHWRSFLVKVAVAHEEASFLRAALADLVAAGASGAQQTDAAFNSARAEAQARFDAKPDLATRAEDLCGDYLSEVASEEDALRVRRLVNAFQSAMRYWKRAENANERDQIVAEAQKAIQELEVAAAEAAQLVIPCAVRDALLRLRVGRPLNFKTRFREFAGSDKLEQQLLQDLAARPMELPGVVDTENGILYRISPSRGLRLLTAILPFLTALLVAGFILVVDWLQGTKGSELWDSDSLAVTYGAFLAGAVTHLAVERGKNMRVFGKPKIYVPGDIVIWLHLRWASIAASVALVIAVWIFVRYNDPGNLLTYLFAGYSVDSLSGLAFERFSSRAGATMAALQTQINPSPPSAAPATTPTTAGTS
jgi:hypothetical protein